MKLVILAGGKGTRLSEYTKRIPIARETKNTGKLIYFPNIYIIKLLYE